MQKIRLYNNWTLMRLMFPFYALFLFLSCGLFQASEVFRAIESKNKQIINTWLKNNPDVDLLNEQGQTVLMKAVQVGNIALAKRLLQKGASVNVIDRLGKTALDYAVELNNKNIAKQLLKYKAMVTTEVNAVKCRTIIKTNGFKRLLLCGLGLCLVFVTCVAVCCGGVSTLFLTAAETCSGVIVMGCLTLGVAWLGVYASYRCMKRASEHELFVDIVESPLNNTLPV